MPILSSSKWVPVATEIHILLFWMFSDNSQNILAKEIDNIHKFYINNML